MAYGRSKIIETVMSVAAYSTCSIAMVILNKLVIDTHKFNYLFSLLFFQALSALILVIALRLLGFVEYPSLEKKLLLRWLPLTGLFVGMLATSMLGLKTMSISITLLIKNFALIFIAVGYVFFFFFFFFLQFVPTNPLFGRKIFPAAPTVSPAVPPLSPHLLHYGRDLLLRFHLS